jgi:hypothetical protein
LSIRDFDGATFVAFLDICGFRSMLEQGLAEDALDNFFRIVYEQVGNSRDKSEVVDSIVVSDCAMAFARTKESEHDDLNEPRRSEIEVNRLSSLLVFTRNVATEMIRKRVVIRGSIAFGPLIYRYSFEGPGRVKAKFLGKAYIDAYLEAERGLPELHLGEIRTKPAKKIRSLLDANPEMFSDFPLYLNS